MRVELRQFASADVAVLETFDPPPDTVWSIQADVTVAPAGHPPGGDIFQFEICSEGALKDRPQTTPTFVDRCLIVRYYDHAEVRRTVESAIDEAAHGAATWDDFAHALNVRMSWEFENYRP